MRISMHSLVCGLALFFMLVNASHAADKAEWEKLIANKNDGLSYLINDLMRRCSVQPTKEKTTLCEKAITVMIYRRQAEKAIADLQATILGAKRTSLESGLRLSGMASEELFNRATRETTAMYAVIEKEFPFPKEAQAR